MKSAIYARISSDDGTALGVERQVRDCRALAESKGWTVVEPFIDNDVSASNGKRRPHYERMLTALRAGEFEALVVWDIDRLTRTPRELEDIITIADAHGIALASVGGEVDLATEQGRLTARLKGSVARYEVEQASRRLKRKFLERAEAGLPHGKVAYGYRRLPQFDDHGKLIGSIEVLDETQAAIIRDSATRILSGEPVRSVVRDLNARGAETPRGNQWDATMLRQVLLRQRNAGRRVHLRKVIGDGTWPAVLEPDIFDRLVALLTDPGRRTTRGNGVKHLLSGIARCGVDGCDGTMRVTNGRTSGGRTAPAQYNCRKCNRLRRKQADVDELVTEVVIERLARPDGPDLLAGDPQALRDATAEAEAIRARLDLAADNFADGDITADQLKRITAKLRPKLDAAQARVRASSPASELQAFTTATDIRAAWEAARIEVRRAVIDALVTVTILPVGAGGRFDPERVQIEWKGIGAS